MSRLDEKGREIYDLVSTNDNFLKEINKYFNWFSSVPDSCFKGIIPLLKPYYFASRENHMISMAFGAQLANKKPCLFMQNSGLGLSLDAIFGLHELYNTGMVMFLSNRGELKWEEDQHHFWGDITLGMLKSFDCEILDFDIDGLNVVKKAHDLYLKNKIVFIIVHRGNLNEI